MRFYNACMEEFQKQMKGKNVFIFGAGFQLYEMNENYNSLLKKININAIADNDVKKQHQWIEYAGKMLEIISMDELLRRRDCQSVILITLKYFQNLYQQLEERYELKDTPCYAYAMIKDAEEERKLYSVRFDSSQLRTGEELIPRTIHYCWFGRGKKSELYKKCIESWKKYCPDYQIIEWTEDNYDVTKNAYMKAAYDDAMWAFVSDYARIDIVNQFGGIYLDTDVEMVRPFDSLLCEQAFCGFDSLHFVNFGIGFGSRRNNVILQEHLDLYNSLSWDKGAVYNHAYNTEILKRHGLEDDNSFQKLKDITVLPAECFCPQSIWRTGRSFINERTFSVHHFSASWLHLWEDEKGRRVRLKEARYE